MKKMKAFTLIELLVVISIIAILAALMMPAVSTVRKVAKQTICAGNQRQFFMAVSAYANENGGWVPPSDGLWDNQGRFVYLRLMHQGYLSADYIDWGDSGTWNWMIMKPGNPVQCPSWPQPARSPSQDQAYGLCAWMDWTALGLTQPRIQRDAAGHAFNGCFRLQDVPKNIPYLTEVVYSGSPTTGTKWENWAGSPFLIRLTHRGRAVVGWQDGHIDSQSATQLKNDCRVLDMWAAP